MSKENTKSKKIWRIVLIVALSIIFVILSYASYYLLSYKRVKPDLALEIKNPIEETAEVGVTYTAVTYNIGFGAYTADFGFFMDGGTEGRAKSKQSVIQTVSGATQTALSYEPDICFMQEVDTKASRSYKVNQHEQILAQMAGYTSVYAINYNSAYLIYPFHSPLGAASSGVLTLSKFGITSSVRRSLPVEKGFSKYFDLDRCYTVSRVPVNDGRELVLFNTHLSAYTSDGTIADEQFMLLVNEMNAEALKGNYVICGGDFNKDMLGDSSIYFGTDAQNYTWAQPIKEEYLDGKNLTLIKSVNPDNPVPSCRNADGPYHEGQFVITIDGFIVSNNVTVLGSDVIDTGFLYSDHNPVYMHFILG